MFIAFAPTLRAGADTTIVGKKLSILPVPAIGYAPETNMYFGGVVLFSKKITQDDRASNAKVELNYSLKNQLIIEIGWNIFTQNEKFNFKGNLQRRNFPDFYYGASERKYAPAPITYDSKRTNTWVSASKQILPFTFMGALLRYSEYWDIVTKNSAIIYEELHEAKTYGAGVTFLIDSRSNLLNPKSGKYMEITPSLNKAIEQPYVKIIADFRHYQRISKHWCASIRLYNEYNTANPPFFDMAIMGGDQLIRGYYLGMYRSKGLSVAQTEIRGSIYQRLGAAFFGGAGLPFWDTSSLQSLHLKPNVGAGLRYLIDKTGDVNLRLDFAHSLREGFGFYIAFGESF